MSDVSQNPIMLSDTDDFGPSMAVAYQTGEIDQQVATAKKYPRAWDQVRNRITSLATIDKETSEECIYSLPRAGKSIRGPSIRFAEIVLSQYGNARVGARVIAVDRKEKVVIAQAVFHDLETNVATSAEVRRRIVKRDGKLFDDDMIIVTGNAAISIAKRNAILASVPKSLWMKAIAQVELAIKGDIKTLVERRDKAIKAFADFGVKPDQLCTLLDVPSVGDITLDDLATLIGYHAAIKSGESTVEDIFAPPPAKDATPKPQLKHDEDDVIDQKDAGGGTDNADNAEEKPKVETKKKAEPKPKADGKPATDFDETRSDQREHKTTDKAKDEPDLSKVNPTIRDAIEQAGKYATWPKLEEYLQGLMRNDKFNLLMGLDEHLPLWDYIKTLPVWEHVDHGSPLYTKIKSGL